MRKTTPFLIAATVLLTAALFRVTGAWVLLKDALPHSLPKPTPLPPRVSLTNMETVSVEDDWQGTEQFSPVTTQADLSFIQGKWQGEVTLSVRSDKRVHEQWQTGYAEKTVPCTVPAFVMRRVFQQVSRVPLQPNRLSPVDNSLENHPTCVLVFQTSTQRILLQSESPAGDHAPWNVQIPEGIFLTRSGLPFQALRLLRPFLHENELAALKKQAAAVQTDAPAPP